MDSHCEERGFTLLETLVIVVLVGVIAAFAIPALGTFIQQYRLNKVAREIKANVQLARIKAVTSNFNVIFTYTVNIGGTPDSYQIAGMENPGGGSPQPWQDINGNGVNDGLADNDNNIANGLERPNLFTEDREVEFCEFGIDGIANYPNGVGTSDPTDPINFTFDPKGNVSSNYAGNCIPLQNKMKMTQVVCVYPGGNIRMFKWQELLGTWLEVF